MKRKEPVMKRTLVILAAVGWVLSACSAIAGNGNPIN
jgi:hypothetical protein